MKCRLSTSLHLVLAGISLLVASYVDCCVAEDARASVMTLMTVANNSHSVNTGEEIRSTHLNFVFNDRNNSNDNGSYHTINNTSGAKKYNNLHFVKKYAEGVFDDKSILPVKHGRQQSYQGKKHSTRKLTTSQLRATSVAYSRSCYEITSSKSQYKAENVRVHPHQLHDANFNLEYFSNSSLTKERVEENEGVPYRRKDRRMNRRHSSEDTDGKVFGMLQETTGTVPRSSNLRQPSRRHSKRNREASSAQITPLDCARGRSSFGDRIVGGKPAGIDEFPYLASLQTKGSHHCGANILSHLCLLTAAHCFVHYTISSLILDPSTYTITAGTNVVTSTYKCHHSDFQVRRKLNLIVVHPDFNKQMLQPDIALIRIDKPLKFGSHIQSAILPDDRLEYSHKVLHGLACYAAGWGATEPVKYLTRFMNGVPWVSCNIGGRTVLLPQLQKVTLPLISTEKCSILYGDNPDIVNEKHNLCTLSTQGKDACNGDSGGPLTCMGYLVGLVSWGKGCANETYPGVYARVDTHLDWIRQMVTVMDCSSRGNPAGIFHCLPAAVLAFVFCLRRDLMSIC